MKAWCYLLGRIKLLSLLPDKILKAGIIVSPVLCRYYSNFIIVSPVLCRYYSNFRSLFVLPKGVQYDEANMTVGAS